MGKPTKPNRSKKATASDSVHTPDKTAQWIINYFNPQGSILDPCAGANAFFDKFINKNKFRCEINDGTDFLEWTMRVDWIISNPPYSIYDIFIQKAFAVSDNVVFFAPIAKAFKSNKLQKIVTEYGGLREIVYMGAGSRHGFGFGFPVGCLYYKRGFVGDCKITNALDGW